MKRVISPLLSPSSPGRCRFDGGSIPVLSLLVSSLVLPLVIMISILGMFVGRADFPSVGLMLRLCSLLLWDFSLLSTNYRTRRAEYDSVVGRT